MVYSDRKEALRSFLPYTEGYVQDGTIHKREVVFVGSSLKGVIEDDLFGDQLRSIIDKARKSADCACFFLLTHPFYSRNREVQEDRPPTGIAKEILYTLSWLEAQKADAPNIAIKVYKGTPTCFMISTSEKMLINPYPYQVEAYRCFCLEVEANESQGGIFRSYRANHFHRPWFGDEGEGIGRTHYRKMQPNALDYIHCELDGPIDKPERRVPGTPEKYGECFIIPDQGSIYVAVNVRALASDIPFDRCDDGSEQIMKVSDRLEVRLLNLSETDEKVWEPVGTFDLDRDRNGFWHGLLPDRSIFPYSMLGVFDPNQSSPFQHAEHANEKVRGKPLPVLWTRLPPIAAISQEKKAA